MFDIAVWAGVIHVLSPMTGDGLCGRPDPTMGGAVVAENLTAHWAWLFVGSEDFGWSPSGSPKGKMYVHCTDCVATVANWEEVA